MKVTKHSNKDEPAILIGMIVHPLVLARIADKWSKDGLFNSKWANIVGKLAVNYYRKYSKAPGPAIESLFQRFANRMDEDTTQLIEKFLGQLSDQHRILKQQINPEFLIDQASAYFNRVAVKRLAEQLENDVDADLLDQASSRIASYSTFNMTQSDGVDVFDNELIWEEAIKQAPESIIKYPGALGTFFGDDLARDCFVAFMAPEKRGKTWWLIDFAMQALASECKVAFFEVGDMSRSQIMRRIATRVSGRPMKPKEVKYPTAIIKDEEEGVIVEREVRRFDKALSYKRALKAMQSMASFKGKFMLSVHSNSSINVQGIRGILDGWHRERNWTPDVIIIDYADILAPPVGMIESRDQINATWKQLRGLSQDRHCLVTTATQASAASYRMDTLSRDAFSEDKRKYAHVTGMLGINSSATENQQGLYRLNWVVLRESEFQESDCVLVASCLGLGLPAVLSSF